MLRNKLYHWLPLSYRAKCDGGYFIYRCTGYKKQIPSSYVHLTQIVSPPPYTGIITGNVATVLLWGECPGQMF